MGYDEATNETMRRRTKRAMKKYELAVQLAGEDLLWMEMAHACNCRPKRCSMRCELV